MSAAINAGLVRRHFALGASLPLMVYAATCLAMLLSDMRTDYSPAGRRIVVFIHFRVDLGLYCVARLDVSMPELHGQDAAAKFGGLRRKRACRIARLWR